MQEEKRSSTTPVRLAYGSEHLQFGDLYLPAGDGPYPVIPLIHGGYWRARYDLTLMNGLAQDLAHRGYAAWNIEYRRVRDKGGGWPGTFLDVERAVDYLRVLATRYQLDLRRVVPIGHSAGGHLAFWLAARSRIPTNSLRASSSVVALEGEQPTLLPLAGAISLAGVLDLEMAWKLHLSNDAVVELLGATFPGAPERYNATSPVALLPLGIPQILIHGTRDSNVPIEISRIYAAKAKSLGDPVTYLELEGIDHFDVIDPGSTAWEKTADVLKTLLQEAEENLA
ncbi:MAG TPA: alpha/beta hydrolase [Ktedonobacteraceae bacterium]|nr:alpha/beta hydrolase [Ktedonobacteraceae bacterium]